MKITLLFFIILFSLYACEKDESIEPNSNSSSLPPINNNVQKEDLKGVWKATFIKGDNNLYYNINEFLPYSREHKNQCTNILAEYKFTDYKLIIDTNDTLRFQVSEIHRSRDIVTYDTINCNHKYSDWQHDSVEYEVKHYYALLDSRRLALKNIENNEVVGFDTLGFNLRVDLLDIFNPEVRFKR